MSDPNENEQRRFERFQTESAVWARRLDDGDEHQLLEVVNISAGGMLVAFDLALEPDTRLDLRFELPQHPGLIAAEGHVVRLSPTEDGYLLGIAFDRVANLSIGVLTAYLEAIYK